MISAIFSECLRLTEDYPLIQLATIATISGYVYYQILLVRKAILHSKAGSSFTKDLLKEMPILQENCKLVHSWIIRCLSSNFFVLFILDKPTFWCFESRMQTVFSSLLRRTLPDISYKREVCNECRILKAPTKAIYCSLQILKLFDGGEVCLDWIGPEDSSNDSPICLFLPGLTGHSQSEYIKSFVNVARKRLGARCIVFNFRGRGGHALKTARTYCASNSEDLAAVIDHIGAQYPDAPLLALGVSLGGIILGNYLANESEAVTKKLKAAMLGKKKKSQAHYFLNFTLANLI